MTPVIFSALMALAAGDAEGAKRNGSAQTEPKQVLTTVTLGDSPAAAKKSAMKVRGLVEHPAPAMPPLVATVQPDGSLRYDHGHQHDDAAPEEKPQ